MPNSNTSSQATQGVAPVIHSHEDDHAFNRLRHLTDAMDFALRGAALARQQADRRTGEASASVAMLWNEAADAFDAAYVAMQTLVGLPDTESFARAKELLHTANHLADEADGAAQDA
jgi:hypothetical protein